MVVVALARIQTVDGLDIVVEIHAGKSLGLGSGLGLLLGLGPLSRGLDVRRRGEALRGHCGAR